MDLEPALLAKVLAEPDADPPRLILADWLEEHGDPARAELIRQQITIAQGAPDDRRVVGAQRRVHALLMAHGRRWRAALPDLGDVAWGDFERGFVSGVRIETFGHLLPVVNQVPRYTPVTTVQFEPLAATNPKVHPRPIPWLRTLRVSGAERFWGWDQLSELDQRMLRRMVTQVETVELALSEREQDFETRLFEDQTGATPNLRHVRVVGEHTAGLPFTRNVVATGAPLRTLHVGTDFIDYDTGYFDDPHVGDEGVRLLAESPLHATIEVLNLDRHGIGPEGLVTALTGFPALRSLSVGQCELDPNRLVRPGDGAPFHRLSFVTSELDDRVFDLLDHPRTGALRALHLADNDITEAGLRKLVGSDGWTTLRVLDLSLGGLLGLGDVFASAPPPSALHHLRLSRAGLFSLDVEALTALPWVHGLDTLELGGNNLIEGALRPLVGSDIAVLGLGYGGLEPRDLDELAPVFERVEQLDLSGNPVASGVGPLLERVPRLQALRLRDVMGLDWDPLWGAGAPALHTLDLRGTQLTDDGLTALLDSPLADQLLDLDLRNCQLTPRSYTRLAAWPRLPKLRRLLLLGNAHATHDELVRLADALPEPIDQFRIPALPWQLSAEAQAHLHERLGPGFHRRMDHD